MITTIRERRLKDGKKRPKLSNKDGTTKYVCPRCMEQGKIIKVTQHGERCVETIMHFHHYFCSYCLQDWAKQDAVVLYNVTTGVMDIREEAYAEGYDQGLEDSELESENTYVKGYGEGHIKGMEDGYDLFGKAPVITNIQRQVPDREVS